MSQDISARNVKKFDGQNFQCWKFQMMALFTANEINSVVDGTRAAPDDRDSVEGRAWVRDDAKAKFLIASALESKQLESLLTCESSKDMWVNLCRIHEQKSSSNKLLLLQRFHEYRMSPNDSVVQHVAKIRNMAAQIEDVGESVPTITVIAKILGSLSSKFATLQTAWDSVEPARQTLENLEERLIREEMRLGIESSDSASALAAEKHGKKEPEKKKRRKPKRSKENIECFKCHNKGHFASECPTAGNDEHSRDCAFMVEEAQCGEHTPKGQPRPAVDKTKQKVAVSSDEVWLMDSGASKHMTGNRDWFTDFRQTSDGSKVSLGDGKECSVAGEGTVRIQKLLNGLWFNATLENVLYVPNLRKNLFSVGACTHKGFDVSFRGAQVFLEKENRVVASGVRKANDVYCMLFRVVKSRVEEANASAYNLRLWHERLGHVNKRAIRELVEKGLVQGVEMNDKSDFDCEMCHLGKAHRLPFKKAKKVLTKPGEVMHTDVCGPMSVESPGGSKYFLTFKDDATGYRHVYFLRHKSDVFEKFKVFEKLVANKYGNAMKILRSDNGREFCNENMTKYLEERGIRKENTAPYTPQQNGKAERDNRTIVECARTMLHAKSLPLSLWAEAVNTAVYLLNRTVVSGGTATPYEKWIGKKPTMSHIRIFGSSAIVHTPKQFTKKFDLRGSKLILVGYDNDSTNYRLYDPATKRIKVSRDVTFLERVGKEQAEDEEEAHIETVELPKVKDENEVPRQPAGLDARRQDEPPEEDDNNEVFVDVGEEPVVPPNEEGRNLRNRSAIRRPSRYESDVAEYITPNTYKEAVQGSEAAQWARAIKEELHAHKINGTWSIVGKRNDMKLIDSKWVFRVKKDPVKDTTNFKARLCARGFMQKRGVDYTETFAPVVRYDSLRVLLAIVAEKDLELLQFDVQTAFLYGELKEDIYMIIPEGLEIEESASESVVCKLNKSLYGLKQAPRCWNQKFTGFLKEFNFKCSDADPCIFVGNLNDETVYLALFVDDGLVAANKKSTLTLIAKKLRGSFEIRIGDVSSFVGMEITRDRVNKSLVIKQRVYIEKILEKFGMRDSKPVSVPADPHTVLHPIESENEKTSRVPFREAVGSLVFLSAVSRPDIAFAVNSVSKFLNNHSEAHWHAVKRIFAYLKGTIEYEIKYKSGGSEKELIGFSDADYAGDVETRRSTTGYIFCVANGPVSWSCQRQKLVVLSTTEAEYVAVSTAAREAIWLRTLLKDIGFACAKETVLHVDNQSSIRLVENPVFHKRTKHIDIRYHYIREKYENKEIIVKYIPTELQRADILTKALSRDRLRKLCELINIVSL